MINPEITQETLKQNTQVIRDDIKRIVKDEMKRIQLDKQKEQDIAEQQALEDFDDINVFSPIDETIEINDTISDTLSAEPVKSDVLAKDAIDEDLYSSLLDSIEPLTTLPKEELNQLILFMFNFNVLKILTNLITLQVI